MFVRKIQQNKGKQLSSQKCFNSSRKIFTQTTKASFQIFKAKNSFHLEKRNHQQLYSPPILKHQPLCPTNIKANALQGRLSSTLKRSVPYRESFCSSILLYSFNHLFRSLKETSYSSPLPSNIRALSAFFSHSSHPIRAIKASPFQSNQIAHSIFSQSTRSFQSSALLNRKHKDEDDDEWVEASDYDDDQIFDMDEDALERANTYEKKKDSKKEMTPEELEAIKKEKKEKRKEREQMKKEKRAEMIKRNQEKKKQSEEKKKSKKF